MSDRIPAEVFPPGDFLRDELEARNWTQGEFAEIIGRSQRLVNEIISGKRGITPATAKDLAAALGTSPYFWLNLETSYQLGKAEPASETISRSAKLRGRFPVRDMIKRGWVEASNNPTVLESRVLQHFDLQTIDGTISFSHAARRTKSLEEHLTPIQLAWLFRVRQLAQATHAPAYSARGLRSTLGELELLMEEPEEARHVPRILENVGVRFLVVEPIPRSKIEGVCFWLENKYPVVGLSMRLDRIDNFWFNLRHELEHVLNKDGKAVPIVDEPEDLSGNTDQPEEERLANEAAAEFCVPQSEMGDFIDRLDPVYSTERLIGFSRLMKRHPGIVAGQLQRRTQRWELFRRFQTRIRHIVTESALTDGYGHTVQVG